MKKTLILFSLLFIFGCQNMTAKEEFNAVAKTYLLTARTLRALREADKLNEDDIPKIRELLVAGNQILDLWYESLDEGKPSVGAADALEAILIQLLEYQKGAEDGQ